MTHVCLVGLGLIGGSLGKDLRRVKRKSKRVYRVTGWGRSRGKMKQAKSLGVIDRYFIHLKDAVSDSDVVVLCVPVQKLGSLAKQILPHLKKSAILTDVGSVKDAVIKQIKPQMAKTPNVHFVGGHPIAGSEKTGVENAQSNLFQGARCVLTTDLASLSARKKVAQLWTDVGMSCVSMSAKEHDRALAITSHLPHLLSFSLKSLAQAEARRHRHLLSLVGGSFRDMTRVAQSDLHLWKGIFQMNKKEIKKATQQFYQVLSRFPSSLHRD